MIKKGFSLPPPPVSIIRLKFFESRQNEFPSVCVGSMGRLAVAVIFNCVAGSHAEAAAPVWEDRDCSLTQYLPAPERGNILRGK